MLRENHGFAAAMALSAAACGVEPLQIDVIQRASKTTPQPVPAFREETTVFIDCNTGATVTCGDIQEITVPYAESYCPPEAKPDTEVHIPSYAQSAKVCLAIAKAVACVFAPLKNVHITTEEPSGPSSVVYVGGKARVTIDPETDAAITILGMAPLDTDNTDPFDTIYVAGEIDVEEYKKRNLSVPEGGMSPEQIGKVITHEMGHAVGGLPHNKDIVNDGPSIMNRYLDGDAPQWGFTFKEAYILENVTRTAGPRNDRLEDPKVDAIAAALVNTNQRCAQEIAALEAL